MHPYETEVINLSNKHLVGRKILAVRHMTKEEAEESGWYSRSPVLVLDDGTFIIPMRDDEGNDGGAFGTNIEGFETIAVMR